MSAACTTVLEIFNHSTTNNTTNEPRKPQCDVDFGFANDGCKLANQTKSIRQGSKRKTTWRDGVTFESGVAFGSCNFILSNIISRCVLKLVMNVNLIGIFFLFQVFPPVLLAIQLVWRKLPTRTKWKRRRKSSVVRLFLSFTWLSVVLKVMFMLDDGIK